MPRPASIMSRSLQRAAKWSSHDHKAGSSRGLIANGELRSKQALDALGDHPRLGQRQDMARANQAAIAVRAAAADLPALDQGHPPAGSHEKISARRADDAAADHDRVSRRRIRGHRRMPIASGSAGSMISVDSALTYAVPRIRGRTRPSTIRTEPSKMLPMMLSCRQTSPSRSLPSALKHASLALVPVPQGERSYALPGQRTKFLLSAPGTLGGPKSSIWSISAPSGARDPCRGQGLANPPGDFGQPFDVGHAQGLAVIVHQKEPVSAPGDVSHVGLQARHGHAHVLGQPVALDVVDRHGVGTFERDRHRSDGRFEPVRAGPDPPQVGQGDGHADRPVAAHAEVADVVEEDHAGRTRRIDRRQQDRTDHDVRPARLVDDRRAKRVVPVAEDGQPLGHGAGAQIGPARGHDSRRLAAGMSVDHRDTRLHVRFPPRRAVGRFTISRTEPSWGESRSRGG